MILIPTLVYPPSKNFQTAMVKVSLLTVICKAKKFHHRLAPYLQAQRAYTAATFNVCRALCHQLHPQESPFKISIAEFSL
jgi:hypothetical protein